MKLTHIFLCIKKLFTLKHSCIMSNFTLKRSCLYAETLLRSIYTYIYLYIKTCSCQHKNVNNDSNRKSKVFATCFFSLLFSGCCKQNPSEIIQNCALNLSSPPYRIFRQISGNSYKPSAYFTCCEIKYPYLHASKIEKPITFSKVNKSNKSNHFNFKGE